jgi:phosphoserine aminotransferase
MRTHNFSAGPGALPEEVLAVAQRDLVCHPDFGASIMEISHRSKGWMERQAQIERDLRTLGGISDEYAVLFLQGGASTQFAMVPMNLLPPGGKADYVVTGTWATKAIEEAQRLGYAARAAASSKATKFDRIPTALDVDPEAAYLHYTSNNTIYGTEFQAPPDPQGRPLVCDASSDILARPLWVEGHDLIYAGAQKNMGPAGVTVVIVKKALLDRAPATLPTMLAYKTHADNDSMYNTPPVWAIYMVGLVARWVLDQGGLVEMERRNRDKAALLYDAIDAGFYQGHAQPDSRSLMNVTFRLPSEELEAKFIKEATAQGLSELKGHRSVGGCRASIYNAVPRKSVEALADFMRDFARKHG